MVERDWRAEVLRLQREKGEEQQRIEYLCEEVTRLKGERDAAWDDIAHLRRAAAAWEEESGRFERQTDRYAEALRAIEGEGYARRNEPAEVTIARIINIAKRALVGETEERDG